jgi:hypothetical protein
MTHEWWTPQEVLTVVVGFFALCVVVHTVNTLLGKIFTRWIAPHYRRKVVQR